MIRLLAKWVAKREYVYETEKDAARNDINAAIAEENGREYRAAIKRFTDEADGLRKRIEEVAANEEKGFWLCDDGHEFGEGIDQSKLGDFCHCGQPMKFIKRSEMTKDEKKDSDRGRSEVERMEKEKRDGAKLLESKAEECEQAAKMLRDRARGSREFADKIRHV